MFTGIIEEIGVIKDFVKGSSNATVIVECKKVLGEGLDKTKVGDSIAIDGVCQTVTQLSSTSFSAQVSSETLNLTSFQNLKKGQKVNLERALTLNSRLGGHIVSGHVDGLGKIKKIEKLSEFYNISFEVESDLSRYIAKKGSVTINGISLTVADIRNNEFSVAVIPHTYLNTSLNTLSNGAFVNIEVDILAKYVEKILSTGNNEGIGVNLGTNTLNENFLKENGFF